MSSEASGRDVRAPEPTFSERLGRALPQALALGALAAVLAYPSSLVMAARNPLRIPLGATPEAMAAQQAAMQGLSVLLASFIGLFWRQRAGYPGLYRPATAPRPLVPLAHCVGLGLAGSALSVWWYDRFQAVAAPGLYASTAGEGLALFTGGLLVQEAVGRMCFLTLITGLTHRPRAALVIHALWIAFLTFALEQRFLGRAATPDALAWCGVVLSLLGNLLFGATYASHGLAGSLAVHAAWNVKLLLLRAP